MNKFQQKCVEVSQQILQKKGFTSCQFQEVKGKKETYFLTKLSKISKTYEIYIYDDEAGIAIGKEWFICERPDFSSDQELIDAFSKMLLEKLPKADFEKS